MYGDQVFLRQNVCVQPTVARWNATEQLIPPLQSALNLKNVQLEILRSYVDSPDYHWQAAHTPSLMGGPWVDVEPTRATEVECFLAATVREQKSRLQLADDIETLDRLLRENAKGGSLVGLYQQVPESLRGYVELVYDAAHQPSARYIEAMLYRSPHYDSSLQSIGLSLIFGDHRAPQFTTPLLEKDPVLCLRVPFAHPALDMLFAMKYRSGDFDSLCDHLGLAESEIGKFRDFFAPTLPSVPARDARAPGVRIRYFGHACVLFEAGDVSILVDPLVSYDNPSGPRRFTYCDLPDRIDYVAITHFHKDHLNLETLLQLRGKSDAIVIPKNGGGAIQDPSFRLMLAAIGFRNIIELDRLETLAVSGGEIVAIPFLGEHGDLDIQSKSAYLIRLDGTSTLCAADSANVEPALYDRLQEHVGEIDVLFLGMECVGAPLTTTYGGILLRSLPRNFDQERRTTGSDYVGAIGIIERLRPKQVYVYAMGLEPWLGHLLPIEASRDAKGVLESDRVVAECRRRGMIASRPYCAMEVVL
jgi:L-ascorbate metabolism protein UlaG (beta-lactamase superfamily)